MLIGLHVKNIALIDEVLLDFHSHLNIFSGETGAGKSMLIDSIQFAIGNRTSRQIIRKGQQCAYVKITFEDTRGHAIEALEIQGIPYDDTTVEIERTLYASGRTVYKINGISCTRQVVKELATLLIDVHGQHEPQSLLDVTKHLEMLDGFGDGAFEKTKKQYQTLYAQWRKIGQELAKTDVDDRKKLQLKDMLEFQIEEIKGSNLKVDEEETLKAEYDILSHAEKIMGQCERAYTALEKGEKEQDGATSLVGRASYALQDISHISPELAGLYEQLLSIEAQLQDVSYEIRRYTDHIEYSPDALLQVQERLDQIYRLKQKYGSSIGEILTYKEQCEQELQALIFSEEKKEQLQKEHEELTEKLAVIGEKLSASRRKLAKEIEQKIDYHLHDLQMPHAKFEVYVGADTQFGSMGKDQVEFLIRTNLGEDVHALAKIASGGEISRVMLAIKTVLVLGDTIETVIFDEIDTGISGMAAQKVGEKLATISRKRQVICITHLPQIAAMGDRNYLIEKRVEEEQTKTSLIQLEMSGLYQELGRMMGGFITQATLESAKEIKNTANKYKESIQ